MEDFNLHLTGDIHAITAANNLLAAAIDARMLHEAELDEDAFRPALPGQRATELLGIMLRRLAKLGILKTDPDDLTAEGTAALPVWISIPPASPGVGWSIPTTVFSAGSPSAGARRRAFPGSGV